MSWQGGMPVLADGRVHTTLGHDPSTLRLSSRAPNLQNIPQAKRGAHERAVRNLFLPDAGHRLVEADFRAIEAVLVGYFAQSPRYLRLAKLGIHDYMTAYLVKVPVEEGWSDADLAAALKDVGRRWPKEREVAKRTIHRANYLGSPQGLVDLYPELFPTAAAARTLQAFYFDLCPEVQHWHSQVTELAAKQGHLRNPFGYVHRFWRVFEWEKTVGGWQRKLGDDARRAIAYLPQSTAAGIIKEALLRLWQHAWIRPFLRLQIHDSILASFPLDQVGMGRALLIEEMARPNPELPCPLEWGQEAALAIDVEVKEGPRWGEMA